MVSDANDWSSPKRVHEHQSPLSSGHDKQKQARKLLEEMPNRHRFNCKIFDRAHSNFYSPKCEEITPGCYDKGNFCTVEEEFFESQKEQILNDHRMTNAQQ